MIKRKILVVFLISLILTILLSLGYSCTQKSVKEDGVSQLQNQISALEEELASKEGRTAELHNQIAGLEEELAAKERAIEELEAKLAETTFTPTIPKVFRIDFKNPDGTNYGDYNTSETWDDVRLVAYDFEERARTAYLHFAPNHPEFYVLTLQKVPSRLVKKIEEKVQTIETNNPGLFLEVAEIIQQEVLNFNPTPEEVSGCYTCVERSRFLRTMIAKEFDEMGLKGSVWINQAFLSGETEFGHSDICLYDENKQQLYVVYTHTAEGGIEPWGRSIFYQREENIHTLEYDDMKLIRDAKAKRYLLAGLLDALDTEGAHMTGSVTMTDEHARYLVNRLINSGLDKELFEEAWKIFSFCESDFVKRKSATQPIRGEKGLAIFGKENPIYRVVDQETWLNVASDS